MLKVENALSSTAALGNSVRQEAELSSPGGAAGREAIAPISNLVQDWESEAFDSAELIAWSRRTTMRVVRNTLRRSLSGAWLHR